MPESSNTSADDKESLLFADEPAGITGNDGESVDGHLGRWKLMIIDDDETVHSVTTMVLHNFIYNQRGLEIIHGYSGAQACELMRQHPDTAVLLLDVVMETDSAGLDAVKYIREVLKNRMTRIILRTGQPGQAPEYQVIRLYDINDYKEKSDLTAQRLEMALITSLRSYDDISTIQQLMSSNDTLESLVAARTQELTESNTRLLSQIDERIKAHEALKQSESRLAEAQRIANIGNFEWDVAADTMSWSDQIYHILDMPLVKQHHTMADLLAFIPEDDRNYVQKKSEHAIRELGAYEIEHRLLDHSGHLRYVRQQGEVSQAADGGKRVVGTLQDITERRLAEHEMRKLSTAVEQIADGIMITDQNGIIEYVNPAFTRMSGYSREELIGRSSRMLKSGQQGAAFYQRLWKVISRGELFSDVFINRHKSGRLYYEEKSITPQRDEHGEIINYISTGKDVTERIEAQARLNHLAHHDALTGLPNRTLFQDRLAQAIARAHWRGRMVAVLFLDMDRFKIINDTLGHNTGDELLKEMALRLSDCVRAGDSVARLGGDEFAVILNDIAAKDDIPQVAEKIISALATPFNLDGRELFVTTSIGISLCPEDGDNGQTLIKKADAAMYQAKHLGRNNFQFHTRKDEFLAIERLTLESSLRRALERNEFLLYYQPQLNLSSCKISSYEALLRWQHPEFGLVQPLTFVPLLEETGMILPVGEWVLRTACTQERANQQAGLTPKKVAVNISIHQFRQNNFVAMVTQILNETGLESRYLELEITEGVLIDDIKSTSATLKQLHDLGVLLSIDDFGTGYSSMNYLRRLPFDSLKIDKSFINEITSNSDDAAIAAAIVNLAHSIGIGVIAEGVERSEQLCFLANLGCDAIQGYLCSPPLPAAAFNTVVEDQYENWREIIGQ